MRTKNEDTPHAALPPLRPVVFAVLLALSDGRMHGYQILKSANLRLGHRAIPGPGTLYRTLKELRELGLIAYAPSEPDQDQRKQYFRLTARGRRVAEAEARRMERMVEAARSSRLLTEG